MFRLSRVAFPFYDGLTDKYDYNEEDEEDEEDGKEEEEKEEGGRMKTLTNLDVGTE